MAPALSAGRWRMGNTIGISLPSRGELWANGSGPFYWDDNQQAYVNSAGTERYIIPAQNKITHQIKNAQGQWVDNWSGPLKFLEYTGEYGTDMFQLIGEDLITTYRSGWEMDNGGLFSDNLAQGEYWVDLNHNAQIDDGELFFPTEDGVLWSNSNGLFVLAKPGNRFIWYDYTTPNFTFHFSNRFEGP